MKSVVKNLLRLFGWHRAPRPGQPYQAHCLSPGQMRAVNWCEAEWFYVWLRGAGIKHP